MINTTFISSKIHLVKKQKHTVTISTILKNLSSTDKKASKKFITAIREFEEEKKGQFVAFVDEGSDSWDLRLSMDHKSLKIKSFKCDCGSRKKICPHKVAMLMYMDMGHSRSNTLARKIVTKKTTKADKLMSKVGDDDKILEWLRNKLNKDKVFRLAFENDLIQSTEVIDAAFFAKQYQSAYKTVVGRKKYATAAELPKLLDLMQPYIESSLKNIFDNPKNKKNLKLYEELLKVAEDLKYLPKRSTTKTDTHFKKCVTNILPQIPHNSDHIYTLGNLLISADHNMINVFDIFYRVMETYGHLMGNAQQLELLKKRLEPILKYMTSEKILVNYINLTMKLNLFPDLAEQFDLIDYQNRYNKALLEALWQNGLYDQLTEVCKKEIITNASKYQKPYFDYLILIAEKQKNNSLLFDTIMKKIKSIPDYEDYKMLYNLDLNAKQKTRLTLYSKKIVVSSAYGAYHHYIQMKYLFWNLTGNKQKIINRIKDKATLRYALEYADDLWELDYDLFIARAGKVFEYNSIFDDSGLIDVVKKYLRSKLNSLSKNALNNLSSSARKGLGFIGLQL